MPTIAIGAAGPDQSLPDFRTDFPGGVRMRPDVIYWSPRGYRPLRMDIYQPPAATTGKAAMPVILFIHGGGWIAGDSRSFSPIANFPAVLAGIAARGYVVASLDYRFSREAQWPAQGQDIKAGIRWLRAHAADLGADPERIGAWGISAGGQLSALSATTCGLPALQPANQALPGLAGAQGNGDCVQAAAAWFGVYDMTTLTDQADRAGAMSRKVDGAPEWRLLGCMPGNCPPERLTSASAVLTLNDNAAPVLLVTGDSDKVVPYTQSVQFAKALSAQDIPHELMVMPGLGHNLTAKAAGEKPGSLDPAGTAQALEQALNRTLAFFDRELGRTPPASPPPPGTQTLAQD